MNKRIYVKKLLFCLYDVLLYFRKREGYPGIDAEGDDQEGLDGMHDEDKPKSLLIGNTIENEHGLDGKMPGTGTVGRRYDDGKVGHDKGYQRTANAQSGREAEAEEGEIVMQEVHYPDADREEQVERQVLDAFQRKHASAVLHG